MLTHCMLAYHLPLLIAFSIRSVLPQTLPTKPFLVVFPAGWSAPHAGAPPAAAHRLLHQVLPIQVPSRLAAPMSMLTIAIDLLCD